LPQRNPDRRQRRKVGFVISRVLQASSPDEIALVQFAESLGYKLDKRDNHNIVITNLNGAVEKFKILDNFPFTSERKRMGIILKEEATDSIIFYLKGADTVIAPLLGKNVKSFAEEECENLAKEGLRTLVIASKNLTQDQYKSFKDQLKAAGKDHKHRDAKEKEVIDSLEHGIELLGITGVEDKLQDDIKSVIENLRAAGIKVWMLTGDKLETAKCIAISTGMKGLSTPFEVVKNDRKKFEEDTPRAVVVVEGDVLREIFTDKATKKAFIKYAAHAPSVVCCRCAPTQKSEVTEAVKEYIGKIVCCIGDGGNDVGMITSAHVGVGIEGKEGKQAALAADFSIKQFKTIAPLLLWSGRLSYVRTAKLANFVMHRGLIISVIQFLFSLTFQFNTIQIYNGYLMLGYATVFTSLPVFSLIFDEDVKWRQVFDYPQLYYLLQRWRLLSPSNFLIWAWMSIYQGSIIIMLSITLFEDSFLGIVTITFTALIFIELLNVATAVHKFHKMTKLSLLFSVIGYLICLFFLRDLFMLSEINLEFILKIGLITAVAWVPIKLGQITKRLLYPSLLDKVRKEAKQKEKLRRLRRQQGEAADETENLSH
jgi:phospholipid-translocating ATPase